MYTYPMLRLGSIEELHLATWRSRAHRRHADWLLGGESPRFAEENPYLSLRTCLRYEVLSSAPLALPADVPECERREGKNALTYLFSVAAGLDSLVPGETAIQAQIRTRLAELEQIPGFRGSLAHRLFMAMLRCGKAVRSATDLGHHAASWGERVRKTVEAHLPSNLRGGGPSHPSALILGSGSLATEVLNHLVDGGFQVSVHGRHPHRVRSMAAGRPYATVGSADLAAAFGAHGAVISCAQPDQPWWNGHRDREIRVRHERRLFLDLASPRSLDPDLGLRPGVTFLDLSTLPSSEVHDTRMEAGARIVEGQVGLFLKEETRRRNWTTGMLHGVA